jgi:hypothetical protein
MASILRKAAKYRRITETLIEGEAHLKDPFIQPPQLLTPPSEKRTPQPDDITDFPQYKSVPIPESIPYMEGKYRPASVPFVNGTFVLTQDGSPTTPISRQERSTHGARAASVRPTPDVTAHAMPT